MKNCLKITVSALLVLILCISSFAATVKTFADLSFNEAKGDDWGYEDGYMFLKGDCAFSDDEESDLAFKTHTLFIGNSYDSIGTKEFKPFDNLERAELTVNTTYIGPQAFYSCRLKRIGIPASVTYIEEDAFTGSSNSDVVIYCQKGTAAEKFAIEYDYKYKYATPVFSEDGRTCMVTKEEKEAFIDDGWFSNPYVTMYSINGFTKKVFYEFVDEQAENGWYLNEEDTYTTMYSADGRTLRCLKGNVEANKKVGWYTEPVTLMYAPDGKTRYTLKSEIDLYITLGWTLSKDEAYTTMYSADGRTLQCPKANVEANKKVGWYTEPVTLMYAPDGKTRYTLKSEIETYRSLGWYTEPVTVMYAPDGRTRVTLKSEVELYKKVGWYENRSDIYTTMYSADGRTLECLKINVEANKKAGWYENRSDVYSPLYAPDGRVIEKPKAETATYTKLGWSEKPVSITIADYGYEDTFDWEYGGGYLYIYGYGAIPALANGQPWSDYTDRIHTVYIDYGTTAIGEFAFDGHSYLSRIEISPSVTSIGDYAFDGCALTRIGIPKSVTSFSGYAFDTYQLASYSDSANKKMVIYCEAGSAAESFAKSNGIQYVHATPVYYPDGRTCMVTAAEKEIYLRYGWYNVPVTTLYAADGRTIVKPLTEVEIYEKVGWHSYKYDVYTVMYALDGRTLDVLNIKIADYQKVGWYLFGDYICAKADSIINTNGYEAALVYLESWIAAFEVYDDGYEDDPAYIQTVDKKSSICRTWRINSGTPLVIIDTYITYNSIDIPVANIDVRNISDKPIVAFDAKFTCYNAYGEKTWDYGGSAVIDATASSTYIAPGETAGYTITLYSNEYTTTIKNAYVTRTAYYDGIVWYR